MTTNSKPEAMIELIELKELKKQQARTFINAAKAMMESADAFLSISDADLKRMQRISANDNELKELQSELKKTVEAMQQYV